MPQLQSEFRASLVAQPSSAQSELGASLSYVRQKLQEKEKRGLMSKGSQRCAQPRAGLCDSAQSGVPYQLDLPLLEVHLKCEFFDSRPNLWHQNL